MSWTTIATLTLTQEWQLTRLIADELGLIRLTFSSAGIPVEVAQIDPATGDVSDKRRIGAAGYAQIFEFQCPEIWESRAIAVRLPLFASPFEVTIELSDVPVDVDADGSIDVDLQPVLDAIEQINPTATIDPEVLQPFQDAQTVLLEELQLLSGGQSLQLSKLDQSLAQQLQLSQQIGAIDLDIDPQIGANVQSIKDGQTAQNTTLGQLQTKQEQILAKFDQPVVVSTTITNGISGIQSKLDEVLAAKTSLDYYSFLNLFNPFVIAPLNDVGNTAQNPSNQTIGTYSGTYFNNQTNLISRLTNARSTRFNAGGINFSALVNVTSFTFVCRFNAIATATGGFLSVSNSTNLNEGTAIDREIYFLSDGKIAYRMMNGGNVGVLNTPTSYRDGITRTLIVRSNGSTSTIFIDGQKVVEQTFAFSPSNFNNGYWKLAYARNALAGAANGITIQGAAILNAVLSDAQIAAIQTFV